MSVGRRACTSPARAVSTEPPMWRWWGRNPPVRLGPKVHHPRSRGRDLGPWSPTGGRWSDRDMAIADTRTESSALFTVTGHDVVSVTVEGVIDGGAVRGFDAVVDWLVGSPEIVIDLRECAAMDG